MSKNKEKKKSSIKIFGKSLLKEIRELFLSTNYMDLWTKIIKALYLLPIIGVIYLFSYLIIANICNITIFSNIKNISFKPTQVLSSTISWIIVIVLGIGFLFYIVPLLFLKDNQAEDLKEATKNNKLSWIFTGIAIAIFIYMFIRRILKRTIPFIVFMLMLICMYLTFWILCRNSDIDEKVRNLFDSLKKLWGIYISWIIFVYPIVYLNMKNGKLNSLSAIFIFIQMSLVSYWIYKKSTERNKRDSSNGFILGIDKKTIITGLLIPLILALIEKLLKI